MKTRVCQITILSLFLSICDTRSFALEPTVEETHKLSNDVLSVIEGNQATLDSVCTIQAILTKNSTHTHYFNSPHYSDNDERRKIGGFKLIQKHRIRYDGNHFRIDQLEAKVTGDKVHRKRKPYVGTVHIDSPESIIDFEAVSNMVFIRPSEWNDRHKTRTNEMLSYQSASTGGGRTLKSIILAGAENGYYYTAKNETVDGDDCILLTCNYAEDSFPQFVRRIWVAPSKGYCIKKVQDSYNGIIRNEYTTTLKEYSPGLWWFDTVEARLDRDSETIVSRLSVNSLTFNESIDPDVFTVWGLDDVTPQTKVRDEMQGTTYTLAKDYSKDVAAGATGSSGKVLTVGLAILALTSVALLGLLMKRRKSN